MKWQRCVTVMAALVLAATARAARADIVSLEMVTVGNVGNANDTRETGAYTLNSAISDSALMAITRSARMRGTGSPRRTSGTRRPITRTTA